MISALRAAAVTVVALVLLGAPMGLIWAGAAPHIDVAAVVGGSESAFTVEFTDDLVFGLIGVGLGLIAGVIGWLRAERHEIAVVLGLAVGGVLAELIAAQVGHQVRLSDLRDQLPPDVSVTAVDLLVFQLRALAMLVAMPLAAVAAFGAITVRGTASSD